MQTNNIYALKGKQKLEIARGFSLFSFFEAVSQSVSQLVKQIVISSMHATQILGNKLNLLLKLN